MALQGVLKDKVQVIRKEVFYYMYYCIIHLLPDTDCPSRVKWKYRNLNRFKINLDVVIIF